MVVALAGRRIDAEGTEPARFPVDSRDSVQREIQKQLTATGCRLLVCAAACGADLLALDAARGLGIPFRVVLPFAPERFRETSVTDRPGSWGGSFDEVISQARADGSLEILGLDENDESTYPATNDAILDLAARLASGGEVTAFVVWDGVPRSGTDVTLHFRQSAERRGFAVKDIPTAG